MNRYVNELAGILDEKTHQILDKKNTLYGRLLFAQLTLLGILVAFPSATPLGIFSRYLLAVSVVSLGVGILCGVIALRGEIDVLQRSKRQCVKEYQAAERENRAVRPVWEDTPKIYILSEKILIGTTIVSAWVLMLLVLLRILNIEVCCT